MIDFSDVLTREPAAPPTSRPLDLPLTALEPFADALKPDDGHGYARELETITMSAVARAIYLRARANGRTHRQAVRAVNRAQRATARLLGYSYPDAHVITF